jgi:hypothetical protein
MSYLSDRNQRRSRQMAIWLTVAFHLGLGAFVYLQTDQKPTPPTDKATTAHVGKPLPATKSKAVNIP